MRRAPLHPRSDVARRGEVAPHADGEGAGGEPVADLVERDAAGGHDPGLRRDREQRRQVADAADVRREQLGHAAGGGIEHLGGRQPALDERDAGGVEHGRARRARAGG